MVENLSQQTYTTQFVAVIVWMFSKFRTKTLFLLFLNVCGPSPHNSSAHMTSPPSASGVNKQGLGFMAFAQLQHRRNFIS